MPIRVPKKANQATKSGSKEPTQPSNPKSTKPLTTSSKSREFFTAAELARRWSMSERHIRRLTDCGELRTHRFGKAVRFSLADVLVYEASCIQVI